MSENYNASIVSRKIENQFSGQINHLPQVYLKISFYFL
jgi:hypothetical protein